MPITIKSSRMQYRKSNGDYVGVDAVSERKTAEYVSDIESIGSATQSAIEQTASTARDAIDTKAQQARDSIPSDYTALSDEVSELKSALNGLADEYLNISSASFTNGAYIDTTGGVGATIALTPTSNNDYAYAVFPCEEGNEILLTGSALGSWRRLWCFLDSDNKCLSIADSDLTFTNEFMVAPKGSAKLLVNVLVANPHFLVKGVSLSKIKEEIKDAIDKLSLKVAYDDTYNIFADEFLIGADGVSYADGVFTGTAAKFFDARSLFDEVVSSFGDATEWCISCVVKTDGNDRQDTTNGLAIKQVVNGSTTSAYAKNNALDWFDLVLKSPTGNAYPITSVYFDFSNGGPNIWHVKEIQITIGSREQKPFVPHYTAKDIKARTAADGANARINSIINEGLPAEYGIKVNIDGTTERYVATIGMQNDYVVGNSFVNGGHNDFDNVYPWSEMRLCNIYTDSDGLTTITYENDNAFARDGSNGNVFVEIPAYYTKRYRDDDGNEIILISEYHKAGFVREPAFYDSVTGKEIEHIYVGAYLTSNDDSKLDSISGAFPSCNKSIVSYRALDGEMYDFLTVQAWQKLLMIEFGIVNFSPILGGFSDMVWSSCTADETVSNTNSARFSGAYYINNLFVGAAITVSDSFGVIQNRTILNIEDTTNANKKIITFSGDPVNVTASATYLYTTGQKSGWTDDLPYHTGRTVLNNGGSIANQFKYRGIEGLWGNLGEKMDGIICKDLYLYYASLKADYGDITKHIKVNYKIPEQNTYTSSVNPKPPQIKRMGLDFAHPTIALPSEAEELTPVYYGDLFFTIKDESPEGQPVSAGTEFTGVSSMAWDGKSDNGAFTVRFWETASSKSWLYGTRLIKRTFNE